MDNVISELKDYANKQQQDVDIYQNKIKFCSSLDELNHHFELGRKKPSNIKCKNNCGLMYNYFWRFFNY